MSEPAELLFCAIFSQREEINRIFSSLNVASLSIVFLRNLRSPTLFSSTGKILDMFLLLSDTTGAAIELVPGTALTAADGSQKDIAN